MKHQQEVIYLVDRIKQLQTEMVLLRDQNDELTAELETLKLRVNHVKDMRYCIKYQNVLKYVFLLYKAI